MMRTIAEFDLAVAFWICLLTTLLPALCAAQSPDTGARAPKPSVFHVKYISEGTLYIDAGRNADLQEGMKLSVINPPPDGAISEGVRFRDYPRIAQLNVVSVSDSSAICDVVSASGELKIGQVAFLTPGSFEDRRLAESAKELDDYPILVGFTTGDPADAELRATKVENPLLHAESPLGVARARVGFSCGGISEGSMQSKQIGAMIDADFTHLGGTYWNFAGYWRGYMNTSSVTIPGTATGSQVQTLTDLLNRTYTIGFTYNSPYNPNILGVGRLYLPWAPSLSTIDGAYYGRRVGNFYTVGAFAGSTPNPTSWSYNPDQQIVGSFVSMERGDFNTFHIISTAGVAPEWVSFKPGRQFLFFECTFSPSTWSPLASTTTTSANSRPLIPGLSSPAFSISICSPGSAAIFALSFPNISASMAHSAKAMRQATPTLPGTSPSGSPSPTSGAPACFSMRITPNSTVPLAAARCMPHRFRRISPTPCICRFWVANRRSSPRSPPIRIPSSSTLPSTILSLAGTSWRVRSAGIRGTP